MDLRIIRLGFIIIGALLGIQFMAVDASVPWWIRGLVGGMIGSVVVVIEAMLHRVGRVSVRGFSAAVFGMLFGLIMAKLVSDAIELAGLDLMTMSTVRLALTWVFAYIGMVQALRGRDEFHLIIPYVRLSRSNRSEELFAVDTSAIIDGRIVDLCRTRFLEGRLVIPRFVLHELQAIADSTDSLKRNRGRRGLDVLQELRNQSPLDVRIHEEDPAGNLPIDAKLVKLAQLLGAKIVTNDYNLNKVAELQGIAVLNVNDLAKALRPVVLPGESLEVKPIREGKELNQSVAYLDDGTMVVVEQGRHLIGQTVRVVVTSVLQPSAGRMVFVRPEGADASPGAAAGRGRR